MPHSLAVMHLTKNVCESLLATLLNMPEKTKDGPKARADLLSMVIREELHANCPYDDDEPPEDTESHRKGKKAKKSEYYCPHCVLHSKSEGDQAIYQLPPRTKTSLQLRGEDQKIPRLSEAEVQRDEVS